MNNSDRSSNGFSNGLLVGAILGAAAVFFFGTKKGQKFFKTIREEGLEGFSELEALFNDEDEEEFVEEKKIKKEGSQKIVPEKIVHEDKIMNSQEEQVENSHSDLEKLTETNIATLSKIVESAGSGVSGLGKHTKRFFKGIPVKRRVN